MNDWKNRGFDDPTVTRLFPTNQQVMNHNVEALKGLENPIIRIQANNSSPRARKISDERFAGLPNRIHLA